MINIDIEIPSSSSDATYCVSVTQDDNGVLVSCTCPAGVFGKLCKHKLEVLNACINTTDDYRDATHEDIRRLIEGTDIPLLLADMNRADQEFQRAKRTLETVKKSLEKLLIGRGARK